MALHPEIAIELAEYMALEPALFTDGPEPPKTVTEPTANHQPVPEKKMREDRERTGLEKEEARSPVLCRYRRGQRFLQKQ